MERGGSTALCGLFKNQKLYVINCGDSTSVMIRTDKTQNNKLNLEHKPMNDEENRMLEGENYSNTNYF